MTIYYTLTFCLMVAEVVMFGVLVTPPPYKVRKALFNWLSHSPIVAKVDYGLKIFFIFVKILFVGALEGMWRPVAEAETAKSGGQGLQDVRAETNRAAKFYHNNFVGFLDLPMTCLPHYLRSSQRNAYLTGFTLFLSLVLTRVFAIIHDLIETQTAYAALKQQVANDNALKKEVEELKKKLAAKTQDFYTLKNQAASQAAEYNRLANDYNKSTGAPARGLVSATLQMITKWYRN